MDIPYATHKEATYENFIAECPHCGFINVFNRASDLCTFECIGFLTVRCFDQLCKRDFNINGDMVSTAHEMLLRECYKYIEKKQYMQCILSVAQAYEIFFSHFLNVQLLYRAFTIERKNSVSKLTYLPKKLNDLSKKLYKKIHKFTFEHMRNLFFQLVITNNSPSNLDESQKIIESLNKNNKIKRVEISGLKNDKLEVLLYKLYDAKINNIRNQVVHKYAYRPTFKEADYSHKEANTIISGLNKHFKLRGNVNWHLNR